MSMVTTNQSGLIWRTSAQVQTTRPMNPGVGSPAGRILTPALDGQLYGLAADRSGLAAMPGTASSANAVDCSSAFPSFGSVNPQAPL